jgi:pyridoxine 5-phosphate synthase
MALLNVNIDHVATVRQARGTDEPDPVWGASLAELGGADGITFHLREDRRHINDRDARLLKESVAGMLNMEMAVADDVVALAVALVPDLATIVPERREELTTEGGLNVSGNRAKLSDVVKRLKDVGVELSAFVDPAEEQIYAAKEVGFDAVELWTGGYAHAKGAEEVEAALEELHRGIEAGKGAGLIVHGGHGLTYRNVGRVAGMKGFTEFNIGHSIVSRALFVGMVDAVREMKRLVEMGDHG